MQLPLILKVGSGILGCAKIPSEEEAIEELAAVLGRPRFSEQVCQVLGALATSNSHNACSDSFADLVAIVLWHFFKVLLGSVVFWTTLALSQKRAEGWVTLSPIILHLQQNSMMSSAAICEATSSAP